MLNFNSNFFLYTDSEDNKEIDAQKQQDADYLLQNAQKVYNTPFFTINYNEDSDSSSIFKDDESQFSKNAGMRA